MFAGGRILSHHKYFFLLKKADWNKWSKSVVPLSPKNLQRKNMFLLSMLKTMVYVRCHYRRLRLPTAKRAHLPILMKYYTSNQRYHRQSCSTCPIWNKVQPVKYLQIKSHHYHYHNYYQNQTSTADRKFSPPEEIEKALLTSHKIGARMWCFENWICKYVFTPFAI